MGKEQAPDSLVGEGEDTEVAPVGGAQLGLPVHYLDAHILTLAVVQSWKLWHLFTETLRLFSEPHRVERNGKEVAYTRMFCHVVKMLLPKAS